MKVLHVYKTSLPASNGGVQSFIHNLCKQDSKLGVENTVLALDFNPSKKPITMDGYTVHQIKQNFYFASTGFSISAFRAFSKLASTVDLIHYHYPNPFADLLHLICKPNKPTIVTYHSDIVKQKFLLKLYIPLRNYFLSSVDKIIATSPNYFNSSEILQTYASKVAIIPIGVEHKEYDLINNNRLEYWQNKLQQPFFLFIGALRYYKGLHIALKAIAGTNIQLVIAGTSGVEKDLKEQAKKFNIQNALFLGSINDEDKIALLHLCYGFIFPSHLRSEAFGISLLEAAACGKPMISCEIGTGTTFINIANETGLVIKPEDPVGLKNAMQYLLDNPETAHIMGRNALIRSKKLFAIEKQALSYHKVYKELI